jgi:hypothetical protein
MLQNLPIEFSPDFEYGELLNRLLNENIPGYNAITIKVTGPHFEVVTIQKPAIPNLLSPTHGAITDSEGKRLAWFWACLSSERGQLTLPEHRGFVYKLKGFSIGGRDKLRPVFRTGRSGLYDWYTGEIFVLDDTVTPTSERHDFEAGPAKDALETAVADKLRVLQREAEERRERLKAQDEVTNETTELARLEEEFNAPISGDLVRLHRDAENVIDHLRKRISSLPHAEQRSADSTVKRAEKLKDAIRRRIDRPLPEPQRKRQAARRRADPEPSSTPPPKPSTLTEVFEDANWALGDSERQLLQLVYETIEAVLGSAHPALLRISEELRARLDSDELG